MKSLKEKLTGSAPKMSWKKQKLNQYLVVNENFQTSLIISISDRYIFTSFHLYFEISKESLGLFFNFSLIWQNIKFRLKQYLLKMKEKTFYFMQSVWNLKLQHKSPDIIHTVNENLFNHALDNHNN